MATGFQYIPREPIKPVIEDKPEQGRWSTSPEGIPIFIPDAVVKSVIDSLLYRRENREIAYIALDAQYGSIEDAIILVEDTANVPQLQLLDIIEEIHAIGEEWGNYEGLTLQEFQKQDDL